jgi:hypothetical protein
VILKEESNIEILYLVFSFYCLNFIIYHLLLGIDYCRGITFISYLTSDTKLRLLVVVKSTSSPLA